MGKSKRRLYVSMLVATTVIIPTMDVHAEQDDLQNEGVFQLQEGTETVNDLQPQEEDTTELEDIREEQAEPEQIELDIPDETLKGILLKQVQSNGFEQLTQEALESITELAGARGSGIKSLEGLQYAKHLSIADLRENQITDLTPLESLTELEDLRIASNQITSVKALADLTLMKRLDLRSNSVKDLSPLSELKQLEILDLRENGLSDIRVVASFSQLKELNLRENAVSDLHPIRELVELVELNIHTNEVQDISPLEELVKLESITMRRNQISDISVLANLPLLKDLNLRDNQITSIESLRNHQFLTVRLNLRDNPGLTDFTPVASYYDQIEDVDFVIPKIPTDLSDLDLLDGDSRIASLTKRFLQHNQYINQPDVRQTKMNLLGASPFSFYRGSAHLFFEDAAADGLIVPDSWRGQPSLNTWITGDWHIENIGFYGNGLNEAIFDFNDFDEVAVAPYYYDLLRFGTSLYLLNDVAPGLQLDYEEMEEVVIAFSEYYKEALEDVIGQDVDVHDFRFTHDKLSGLVGATASEIAGLDRFAELGRWTQIVDGQRKMDTSNARLSDITDDERAEIVNAWDTYLEALDDKIIAEVGEEYFTIKDVARRTDAGLGSLGTERYYVLIEGESSGQHDDIILDIKSQLPSAVDKASVGQTQAYPTHADRTVAGMRALHNYPDIHWGRLIGEQHSYLVKERSSYKDEFDQSSFSYTDDLDSFIYYSAKASAYAHVRAADSLGINEFASAAYSLMNEEAFDQQFADLSLQYYGQTLKDHEIYSTLYQNGAFSEEAFEDVPDNGETPTPEPPPGGGETPTPEPPPGGGETPTPEPPPGGGETPTPEPPPGGG
ncbi:DUF2252 family protein, partial [Alkalicoccobacillus porphyridii]